ncbi:5-formyltetrahydrofolate cyclo-ligase [Candidatus Bathyarchaeota archaeon]|nr:5-formyltetrahydrofolate cyclo-ligase [Candidatus Bathyarchaeota archaeon]
MLSKDAIREEIWRLLDESGVSRFPKPIKGRIPNFEGSEKAADRLISQPEFQNAEVVKINPDSPQAPVRRRALLSGKLLIMPTPKLRKGFLILNPKRLPRKVLAKASTIRGAFKYGSLSPLSKLPKVDLIVAGSVAVSKDGVRIGKGGGYSEIEYAILRELKLIDEKTPVFTTVHDLQIVEEAPKDPYDLVVDVIATPSKLLRVERKYPQPEGVMWEKLGRRRLKEIPVLRELKALTAKGKEGKLNLSGRLI